MGKNSPKIWIIKVLVSVTNRSHHRGWAGVTGSIKAYLHFGHPGVKRERRDCPDDRVSSLCSASLGRMMVIIVSYRFHSSQESK